MPLMPARAPLRIGKTINSSMSIVFILEAEVRRSDETKAGIVGGVTQDNHRVISRLPAHGQSFADNRADALPLKLRQHGHGSQSDAAEGGGCVGDCHAREEDMTDHAVVVCGNKRDELSGMRPGEIFALQWQLSLAITSRSCIGFTAASSIGPRANARNEPSPCPRQPRVSSPNGGNRADPAIRTRGCFLRHS